MKFSTKATYGLRAVINLAQNPKNQPKPLSLIAKEENISLGYLEQLFRILKKSGFVKASRGNSGGYHLTKNPKEISIGEIIESLEGSIIEVSCTARKGDCKNCKSKFVWQSIKKYLKEALGSLTLKDLIEKND